jgi:hypothetical protein
MKKNAYCASALPANTPPTAPPTVPNVLPPVKALPATPPTTPPATIPVVSRSEEVHPVLRASKYASGKIVSNFDTFFITPPFNASFRELISNSYSIKICQFLVQIEL